MHEDSVYQTIHLHPHAPPKPALGAACNGCGVCCASEPCPVGMLISRRRRGRCAALAWQENPPRYLCGLISQPQRYSGLRSRLLNRVLQAIAARSIARGIGCDADAEIAG